MPKYYIRDSEDQNSNIYIIMAETALAACIKAMKHGIIKNVTIKSNGHIKGYYMVNEFGFIDNDRPTHIYIPINEVVRQCIKNRPN